MMGSEKSQASYEKEIEVVLFSRQVQKKASEQKVSKGQQCNGQLASRGGVSDARVKGSATDSLTGD